jgi:hypothetical protein
VVEIHVERTIAAPPERVFDWLADPASLTSAPAILRSPVTGAAIRSSFVAVLAGCAKALETPQPKCTP